MSAGCTPAFFEAQIPCRGFGLCAFWPTYKVTRVMAFSISLRCPDGLRQQFLTAPVRIWRTVEVSQH